MLIGLFSLHARSISCCVKRSRLFFNPDALCSEWPGGGGSSIVPRKMNCVFVRGLAAVCASKCECLLSVLLSAIQRKIMLGNSYWGAGGALGSTSQRGGVGLV